MPPKRRKDNSPRGGYGAVKDIASEYARDRARANNRPSSGRPTYNPGGSSGGGNAPKPLGVPEGYTTPFTRGGTYSARGGENAARWRPMDGSSRQNRTPGTIGAQAPRYHEGDEWRPAGLGPVAIGELQSHLAASGVLTGRWRYGIWDENTASAYKSVLEEANAMGLSAQAVIEMRGQSATFGGSGDDGSGGGGGGGGRWEYDDQGNPVFIPDATEVYTPPPLEIKTTNQDDLRSVFRRSVIDTLGQGWSQAQIDELVNAYNWEEIRVQKEAYDRQVAIERADFEGNRDPAGGEIINTVDVASPEAFLENEMIRRDPEGYKAGRIVNDALPAFFSALNGWV